MDIFQESDPKSQDEIPVLSSYAQKPRNPFPRALLKEKFGSNGYTKQAVQLRMFASYRSLGLAFLFRIGDKLLHK